MALTGHHKNLYLTYSYFISRPFTPSRDNSASAPKFKPTSSLGTAAHAGSWSFGLRENGNAGLCMAEQSSYIRASRRPNSVGISWSSVTNRAGTHNTHELLKHVTRDQLIAATRRSAEHSRLLASHASPSRFHSIFSRLASTQAETNCILKFNEINALP